MELEWLRLSRKQVSYDTTGIDKTVAENKLELELLGKHLELEHSSNINIMRATVGYRALGLLAGLASIVNARSGIQVGHSW